MDKKEIEIENGYVGYTGGFRRVAFSLDGTVREVDRKYSTGRQSRRRTLQLAYPGDIVIRSEWKTENNHGMITITDATITASVITETGYIRTLDKTEANEYLDKLLTPELKAFLNPISTASASYLPAGCGWNGTFTNKNEAMFQSFKEFFKETNNPGFIDRVAKAASTCHWKEEFGTWENADQLPSFFQRELTSTDEEQFIVTWEQNGDVWIFPFSNNFTTGALTIRAVHVSFDCYESPTTHKRYGVKWRCYIRK